MGWGQTTTQNFGTGTGSHTSQTGSTAFIPNPTSGTTYARAGATSPNAPIVLSNTSNPLGTAGSYVRAVSSSSASITKVSPIVSYTSGLEFYTSFKVLFGDAAAGSTAASGIWTFYQGLQGSNYNDNNDVSSANTFTGLRFTFGASGALTLTFNNAGTYNSTGLTTSALNQATVYTIEIVGNNKSSGTINYTYNGADQTVAVQKFDLYINGTLIGNDLSKGGANANTNVNATTFTGISSTSNVANLFLDDVVIYNTVPATIGSSGSTPPTLSAAANQSVDNNFNITFTDDESWRAAVTGITVDGTPYLAASGVYSLTSGSLVLTTASINQLKTAGSHTIVVLATGYNNASVTQTNIAGVATKLGITTQPTAPSVNGGALATQPVVRIQDQYSNTTTSTATVVAAVGAGTWTLGGTTSVAGSAGTVTYSGLTATSAAAVTGATIAFSSAGLTGITSNAFNIPAPPPPAPANDNCAGAIAITCGSSVTVDNTSATNDVLPAVSCGVNSVGYFKGTWYTVTPAASGSVTVSACGSSETLDTYLRIYSGTCGSFTTCEGFDDDGCATTAGPSKYTFLATANTTYYILLGMYDAGSTPGSVNISATCPLVAPVATAANPISSNSFTANWNASASATGGYRLDVSSTNFDFASTTETFTAIGGGTTSSYLTRSWTGVDGIAWTSYKTRTDQIIFSGNEAICLRDEAGAYLVSGEITGSPSNITFDIQQKFAGSDGNVLIKILSGAGFSTVTTIGTYGYTTTAGVINANVTDISGPFKVQIENGNTNARPCIDNLAITRDSFTAVGVFSNYSVVGTSQAIGSLSPNSNYYYRVRATDGTNFSASSNTITVNTNAAAASTFTGTTSNEWEVATNWDNGLPGEVTNVAIPANKTVIVNSNDYECNNLTIAPLGALTINTGKDLLVNGDFLIQSDVNGTGSFIENGTLAANTYTVQRYIAGAAEAWHLLSSPVAAQAISGGFTPAGTYGDGSGYDFYAWSEPTETWLNQKVGANNITSFVPGKGYLVAYQAANPTKTFTGALNEGIYLAPLTISGTGDYKYTNLVGNPYPSSIDWKNVPGYDKSDLAGYGTGVSHYIWSETASNYGVYSDANAGDAGTNGASRYIAPMQGFFVIAANAGDFGIDNDARVHSTQAWLKSGNDNAFRLRVNAPASYGSDELLLEFGHNSSVGGAQKWNSLVSTAPGLFTTKEDANLSISYLSSVSENPMIPVAFKAGIDGNYSLTADFNTASFSLVTLIDAKTSMTQNLNTNPVYSFNATTGDDLNRFTLHFGTLGIDNPATSSSISVYTHGETLYIGGLEAKAEISVINLTGQVVMSSRTNGSGLHSLNAASLPKGVYVVSVISNGQAISRKVVL